MNPQLIKIEEINRLEPHEFVMALRPLFELAPPLAEGLFAMRPFRSYEQLLDQAAAVIAGLTDEQKIAVINAHPRIGEHAALVRASSALSFSEQGYDREAGLDPQALEQVYRELAELNRAYEQRFGFRFVVFVNRRPKAAIVGVLRERLNNTRAQEMDTALDAMLAIAHDRLGSMRG